MTWSKVQFLCGGFGSSDVAAVEDRAAVGHVVFVADQVPAAAAYATAAAVAATGAAPAG